MKKKRKWLLPVIIGSLLLLTLLLLLDIFLEIPLIKMRNCIYTANGSDVQRYENDESFINYDEYIKLRVLTDEEADEPLFSFNIRLTGFCIRDGKFEYCLKYSFKIYDDDYVLLSEKGQTCRFICHFQKLKFFIDSVTVEN